MFKQVATLSLLVGFAGSAAAADFDADAHQAKFMEAFNNRQWEEVKSLLAEDAVFHRANATEVYSGPDAIVDHFEQPIGGEWNVKFARLDEIRAYTAQVRSTAGAVIRPSPVTISGFPSTPNGLECFG